MIAYNLLFCRSILSQRQITFTKQRNSMSSLKLQNRILDFVKQDDTSTLLDSYKKGAYPLINPSLHCHRDRIKSLENDSLGGVTVKNYSLAKDRAEVSKQDFVSSHLQIEDYDQTKPIYKYDQFLRVKDIFKQGPPIRHRFRTEHEHTAEVVSKQMDSLDFEMRNMKMVHNSCWKDPIKQKWIEPQRGFVAGKKSNVRSPAPWPQIPFLENEPFIGGFQETEVGIERKRIKAKEIRANEFNSKIRNDPWETTLHLSQSIRTYKADKAMSGKGDQRLFSINNKLDSSSYKQGLVCTGSVDNFVPFNHSNNFQSIKLKDIVQIFPRNYKNSIIHYGLSPQETKMPSQTNIKSNDQITQASFRSKEFSKDASFLRDAQMLSPIPQCFSERQSPISSNFWSSPPITTKNKEFKTPFKAYSRSLEKQSRTNELLRSPKYSEIDPPSKELVKSIVRSYFMPINENQSEKQLKIF